MSEGRGSSAEKRMQDFNAKYAVGSPVKAWTGVKGEGEPLHTKTTSMAFVLAGYTPVVMVEDHPSCIALTHIEPLNE